MKTPMQELIDCLRQKYMEYLDSWRDIPKKDNRIKIDVIKIKTLEAHKYWRKALKYKEKEKQVIIDAWTNGNTVVSKIEDCVTAEEYYNETFKQ